MAVEKRLDDLAEHAFEQDEQGERPERHRPAGIDGGGQRDGQDGRDVGTDIGDEAEHHADDAPQHRTGHTDDGEADADQEAERGIDRELGEEIARQAARRVVDSDGGAVQVARTEQADQTVAEILLLDEDEDRDDEDDADRLDRGEDRREEAAGECDR